MVCGLQRGLVSTSLEGDDNPDPLWEGHWPLRGGGACDEPFGALLARPLSGGWSCRSCDWNRLCSGASLGGWKGGRRGPSRGPFWQSMLACGVLPLTRCFPDCQTEAAAPANEAKRQRKGAELPAAGGPRCPALAQGTSTAAPALLSPRLLGRRRANASSWSSALLPEKGGCFSPLSSAAL